MGKYDEMFDRFFDIESFKGDKEKYEAAKEAFGDIIENFKKGESFDENKDNIEDVIKDINDKLSDNPMGIYNIEEDKVEDIINKYDLSVTSVNIDDTPIEGFEGFHIINEIWSNDNSSYMINQNYPLTKVMFDTKSYNIKLKIVEAILDNNLFGKEYGTYLDSLDKKDKTNIYNRLIDIAVEKENYEVAAKYRDMLENI